MGRNQPNHHTKLLRKNRNYRYGSLSFKPLTFGAIHAFFFLAECNLGTVTVKSGVDCLGTLEIVKLQHEITDSLMCKCAKILFIALKIRREYINGLAIINTYSIRGPIEQV